MEFDSGFSISMDSNGRDPKIKPIISDLMPQKAAVLDKEDSESELLLPPSNGGISKETPKIQRKVQWNDSNGNQLAEVLEFQPSDASDSDDDDSDTCFCTIM